MGCCVLSSYKLLYSILIIGVGFVELFFTGSMAVPLGLLSSLISQTKAKLCDFRDGSICYNPGVLVCFYFSLFG